MQHVISQQLLVEHEALTQVMHALRNTIGWTFHEHEYDLTRKLSSLRFMAHSFQRHLDRLLSLEEDGEYVEHVLSKRPEARPEMEQHTQECEGLRQRTIGVVSRLEAVTPEAPHAITLLCDELLELLSDVEQHSNREIELLRKIVLDAGSGGQPS